MMSYLSNCEQKCYQANHFLREVGAARGYRFESCVTRGNPFNGSGRTGSRIKPMRILVVDDSATMRSIIQKELLALNEKDLVLCDSGDAALNELEKGGIALILLDWHMEGLSGLDVLRIVKHHPKTKAIPVIMLTVEEHARSVQ